MQGILAKNNIFLYILRDLSWFFLQVISWVRMPNDILAQAKFYLNRSIGKNGNRMACKWKVYSLIIFT